MQNQQNAILSNGQTLAFWEQYPKGQDHHATLVFIHGNFSEYQWWREQYNDDRFQNYRIIALDLRGFGNSTYINKCQTFKDWAEDVIELLTMKQIKKVYLVGWSFGGAIAMKAAEIAPQIVEKIVLTCSVSHTGYSNEANRPKTFDQIIKQYPHMGANIQITSKQEKESMKKIFETVLFTFMQNYPQQRKLQLVQSPFRQKCYKDVVVSIFNSDINIEKIKAKALIIHGAKDTVIIPTSLKSTEEHLGKMELWQDNGHMIPIQSIQKYNARLLNFFNEEIGK